MAKKRSPQPRRRGSVLPGVAVAGVALLVVAYYGARTREAPPAAVQQAPSAYPVSAAQAPQIPTVNPEAIVAPDLPPLPLHLASATRPLSVVRAVYEFAARHPEVLQYVPCYCGCELDGHTANDNCFVASREGGRITWDAHGLT